MNISHFAAPSSSSWSPWRRESADKRRLPTQTPSTTRDYSNKNLLSNNTKRTIGYFSNLGTTLQGAGPNTPEQGHKMGRGHSLSIACHQTKQTRQAPRHRRL